MNFAPVLSEVYHLQGVESIRSTADNLRGTTHGLYREALEKQEQPSALEMN